METLLSYEGTNNTAISAGGFLMDTAGKYDTIGDDNKGWKSRKKVGECDFAGAINVDLFKCETFLAPGNRITLKLVRNSDQFVLMASGTENYKIKIIDLALHVRRIRLDPMIVNKVVSPTAPQQYLTSYTELKDYPLASGLQQWSTILYRGDKLPNHIIVGQVLTAAMVGSYSKNPFNFQHFKLSRINLKLNGIRIPTEPLTPDFTNRVYMREYLHLFMNSGKYRVNSGNCLTESDFSMGSTLIPFDLSNDQCMNYHRHRGSSGTLELEIEWSEALPEGITVLVHASSEQVILSGGSTPQPQVTVF